MINGVNRETSSNGFNMFGKGIYGGGNNRSRGGQEQMIDQEQSNLWSMQYKMGS